MIYIIDYRNNKYDEDQIWVPIIGRLVRHYKFTEEITKMEWTYWRIASPFEVRRVDYHSDPVGAYDREYSPNTQYQLTIHRFELRFMKTQSDPKLLAEYGISEALTLTGIPQSPHKVRFGNLGRRLDSFVDFHPDDIVMAAYDPESFHDSSLNPSHSEALVRAASTLESRIISDCRNGEYGLHRYFALNGIDVDSFQDRFFTLIERMQENKKINNEVGLF